MAYKVNATAASLLGFLHGGPMTGWDLMVTAQTVIGDFWSLTQSQVYRELRTMAGAGLIEQGERGPRDRKPFALTDAGRAAFAQWLQRPPGPETIRFPLLLTVAFGRHLPRDQLASHLRDHRAVHERRLAGYEEHRDAEGDRMDPFGLATLQFGITYERAVLDWFDQLPQAMTGIDPEAELRPYGAEGGRQR